MTATLNRFHRTKTTGALVALVLGMAIVAAGSLTTHDRASAQSGQAATERELVQNYDPPTISFLSDDDGVHVYWDFDAAKNDPPGWHLAGFSIRRFVNGEASATLQIIQPISAANDRYFFDAWTDERLQRWSDGAVFNYTMFASYRNDANSSYLRGGQVSSAALPHAVSKAEVRNSPAVENLRFEFVPNGVRLHWDYDVRANTPDGWFLDGFRIRDWDHETNLRGQSFTAASHRTFFRAMSATRQSKYLSGTEISYLVQPIFNGVGPNGGFENGKSVTKTLPTILPQQDVLKGSPQPKMSTKVTADGMKLSWTIDQKAVSMAGWELTGFTIWRWIQKPGTNAVAWVEGSYADVASNLDRTLRTFTDPLTGTSVEQRSHGSGTKFSYRMHAIYKRVVDGAITPGTDSKTAFATTPNLPGIRHFYINTGAYVGSGTNNNSTDVLRWSHPHLTWDSSTGFDSVSSYDIYLQGSHIRWVSGSTTRVDVGDLWFCASDYKIRPTYGVFYGQISGNPIDQRGLCT